MLNINKLVQTLVALHSFQLKEVGKILFLEKKFNSYFCQSSILNDDPILIEGSPKSFRYSLLENSQDFPQILKLDLVLVLVQHPRM